MAFARVQKRYKETSARVLLKMKRIITGREKTLGHFDLEQGGEVH